MSSLEKRAFIQCLESSFRRSALLFVLLAMLFSAGELRASDGLHSFAKTADPPVEPNVLFFLDTSGSMLWPMDAGADERNPERCTFGDGTLGWRQDHKFLQEYYGRDLDPSNNDPENLDHYHPNLIWQRGGAVSAGVNDLLMPNDSRAYKAKLVLWRILNDRSLISGLRIGFATYRQTFFGHMASGGNKVGAEADWYRYPHRGTRIPNASAGDSSPGYTSAYIPGRRFRRDAGGSYNHTEMGPGSNQRPLHWDNSWQVTFGVTISENAQNRRGMLRSDFHSFLLPDGSVDQAKLQSKILRWIDGREEYPASPTATNYAAEGQNPELRFDGWRPLAETLFYRDGNETGKAAVDSSVAAEGVREGSIDQFFTLSRGGAPLFITHHCQDQWVVVMTSGGQSAYAGYAQRDPVEAVRRLYNSRIAVGVKQSQPIRTIVLGFVDPASVDPAVIALRNQLNRMADMGDDGQLNGSATAYFATDVPSMMRAMRQIMATIKAESGTNNVPLLSPASSSTDEDVFFQASYTARADAHWKGDLEKVAFDGETYPVIWSAAEELQKTTWDRRKVYIPVLSAEYSAAHANLARLTTAIAAPFAALTGFVGANATTLASNFIRWFLGDDTYGEFGGRFKLFDIYNSGIVKVGPPNAGIESAEYRTFMMHHRERPEIIYTQSNAGLLHAFNNKDGSERWAFVPPNALVKGRLRGLKWDDISWSYDATKKSYSRYITDGPLVVEDVMIDGEYRTVLLGLLGLGGAGMYAVDITNADFPRFLWGVENDVYDAREEKLRQKKDRNVRVWTGGTTSVSSVSHTQDKALPDAWDYENMRFTVSTPFIGTLPGGEWVFLMGNGTPLDIDNLNAGEVFIGRIKTGELIRSVGLKSNKPNPFVSPAAVLFEGVHRRIGRFFIADSKGLIFMGEIPSADPATWTIGNKEIFAMRGSVGLSYSLDVARFDGDYWLFAGSGDWRGDYLGSQSASNFFVAVNLKDFSRDGVPSFNDLTELNIEDPDSVNLARSGWRITFPSNEYLSSPPVVYNGHVFFATFKSSADPCSPTGSTKLYALKGTSGAGGWDDGDKYLEMPHLRVSGIGFMGGKIVLGATAFEGVVPPLPFAIPATVQENEDIPEGLPARKGMLPLYWKMR